VVIFALINDELAHRQKLGAVLGGGVALCVEVSGHQVLCHCVDVQYHTTWLLSLCALGSHLPQALHEVQRSPSAYDAPPPGPGQDISDARAFEPQQTQCLRGIQRRICISKLTTPAVRSFLLANIEGGAQGGLRSTQLGTMSIHVEVLAAVVNEFVYQAVSPEQFNWWQHPKWDDGKSEFPASKPECSHKCHRGTSSGYPTNPCVSELCCVWESGQLNRGRRRCSGCNLGACQHNGWPKGPCTNRNLLA
jgi:hypothetical protein